MNFPFENNPNQPHFESKLSIVPSIKYDIIIILRQINNAKQKLDK